MGAYVCSWLVLSGVNLSFLYEIPACCYESVREGMEDIFNKLENKLYDLEEYGYNK